MSIQITPIYDRFDSFYYKIYLISQVFLFIHIGDKIEKENKFWALLLKLTKIINLLYSNNIGEKRIDLFENLIVDDHSSFKLLYKDVNFKKKHHNMVHYPSAMRQLGSLVDYCTLRFEGKHTFFLYRSKNFA